MCVLTPAGIRSLRNSWSPRKWLLLPPLLLQSVIKHPRAALPAGMGTLIGSASGCLGLSGAKLLGWARPRHNLLPTHLPATPLTAAPVENARPGSHVLLLPKVGTRQSAWLQYQQVPARICPAPSQCRGMSWVMGKGDRGPQVRCVYLTVCQAAQSWKTCRSLAWAGDVGQSPSTHSGRFFPGPLCPGLPPACPPQRPQTQVPSDTPQPPNCPAFPELGTH